MIIHVIDLGHELIGKVGELPGVYLYKKKQGTVHGVTHPHHHESSEIKWFENQVAKQRFKRYSINERSTNLPTDPFFSQQWHLGTALTNIHVQTAWQNNVTGEGVIIAIVDDGLEHTHPDLHDNYNSSASYDFNFADSDPFPDSYMDDHGTSAAGVAAARDNSVCGVGSAFRAKLSGIRLISRSSTDVQEASALNYRYDINDIYSNSWGPVDDGRRKEGPGRLAAAALQNGAEKGRNGKGSIFVWAGGNGRRSGDNCNYDGWANSRYTISIGAVDQTGAQAWYSESCSMLLASAPSSGSSLSITTTDLLGSRGTNSGGDCTSTFGGTSAAAPLAAGVVALVLQANPNLGWRDVQGVLIESAAATGDPNDGWIENGAGLRYNHKYGFGLIDASAAVDKAKQWNNLPAQVSTTFSKNVGQAIPESNSWGTSLLSSVDVTDRFIVEHVTVRFVATHPRRGELVIKLKSPNGSESYLADKHSDTGANYDWTFGSIVQWGESSSGTWTLYVYDAQVNQQTGSVTSWELTIYGHHTN